MLKNPKILCVKKFVLKIQKCRVKKFVLKKFILKSKKFSQNAGLTFGQTFYAKTIFHAKKSISYAEFFNVKTFLT